MNSTISYSEKQGRFTSNPNTIQTMHRAVLVMSVLSGLREATQLLSTLDLQSGDTKIDLLDSMS